MKRAILIDAENRNVRDVEVKDLDDWQTLVGGSFGRVYVEQYFPRWLPGHVILVDEDARIRTKQPYGFRFNGASPQLGGEQVIGNGLVVILTTKGFNPPKVSAADIAAMVEWVMLKHEEPSK